MKAKRAIMVAMVATVLAADRRVASASTAPLQSGAARRLVSRLVSNFKGAVAVVRLAPVDVHRAAAEGRRSAVEGPQARVHQAQSTPFHFRLPPPLA